MCAPHVVLVCNPEAFVLVHPRVGVGSVRHARIVFFLHEAGNYYFPPPLSSLHRVLSCDGLAHCLSAAKSAYPVLTLSPERLEDTHQGVVVRSAANAAENVRRETKFSITHTYTFRCWLVTPSTTKKDPRDALLRTTPVRPPCLERRRGALAW